MLDIKNINRWSNYKISLPSAKLCYYWSIFAIWHSLCEFAESAILVNICVFITKPLCTRENNLKSLNIRPSKIFIRSCDCQYATCSYSLSRQNAQYNETKLFPLVTVAMSYVLIHIILYRSYRVNWIVWYLIFLNTWNLSQVHYLHSKYNVVILRIGSVLRINYQILTTWLAKMYALSLCCISGSSQNDNMLWLSGKDSLCYHSEKILLPFELNAKEHSINLCDVSPDIHYYNSINTHVTQCNYYLEKVFNSEIKLYHDVLLCYHCCM